ncbi:MAG: response regulator [Gemmatimonadaceae bacterium]|nr:response regulator [Gemmatimonadaceae bacterium]
MTGPGGGMATVLYVDDQEAICRAVRLWLSRKGHVVHLAATAQAARKVISAEPLDGIFIDLLLGAESGLELYRWIDELDADLAQRVAFVTGNLFDETLAAERLDRRVFAKPFELRELEALANRWYAERQPHRDDRNTGQGADRAQPGR